MARSKPTKVNAKKTLPKAKAKPVAAKAPKTVAKTAPRSGDLGAIAKAIGADDAAAALDAALVAWRAARAPALADLVDAISTRLSGSPVTSEFEWTKIAASQNPSDLGRLLAAIRELPVSFLPTVSQRLAAFPDDPRIASHAGPWILDPPTTSSSAYPFWTKLLELLAKLGDSRVIAPMAKRVKMKPPEITLYKAGKPSQFWGKFHAALDKTRAKLAALEVPTVDTAAIAKLTKLAGKLAIVESAAPVKGGTAPAKADTPAVSGPRLVQALAHATGGRVPALIDALLEEWREKRAPEIADLIDRATRLLPTYDLPLAVGDKQAHAAWQAAFAADPIAALPQLVRHVNVGGSSAAVEHLASLATLPDDPRIASRLAEASMRFTISPEKSQYWKTCWGIIARTRDVRVIPSLRQFYSDFSGTYYDHHRSGRRLLGDFLLAELPPSPLDAADYKSLNQIAAALGKLEAGADRRERELIADIVKNWADEGPRLVYADWLSERGNIRGELIVLDCKRVREGLSKAETKQLGSMQTNYRVVTYLLGPISDLEHELDRGIPSKLNLDNWGSPITWRHLAGYPLLAGIEVIEFEDIYDVVRGHPSAADLARVMLDPMATRLAKVIGAPNNEHSQLASELEPLVKPHWTRDERSFSRR